jgi:hypothetical protein
MPETDQRTAVEVWSVTPAERAVGDFVRALNFFAPILRGHTEAMLASLPQWWTLADLEKRWRLSRAQVAAVLVEHCGYTPVAGVKPRIHISDVLRVDQLLQSRGHQ